MPYASVLSALVTTARELGILSSTIGFVPAWQQVLEKYESLMQRNREVNNDLVNMNGEDADPKVLAARAKEQKRRCALATLALEFYRPWILPHLCSQGQCM